MVTEREQLLPGVWIHFEKQWLSADVIDCYADAPVEAVVENPAGRTLASLYPDWHRKAACLGTDEEKFFGARDTTERPALSMTAVNAAQAICHACPVFETCLTEALVNRNEYGIWAGTSGRTRRRIWEAIDAGETTVGEVVHNHMTGEGELYDHTPVAAPQLQRVS